MRPVSQGFVAHRLLGALVPVVWLRAIFKVLAMPLLVDSTLIHGVPNLASTPPAEPSSKAYVDTEDAVDPRQGSADKNDADSLRFGAPGRPLIKDSPTATNLSFPSEGSLEAEQAVHNYQADDEDPPLNLSSRRAQLR